ncbi:hypothetical protein DY000_02037409 [Brassica cretica]|uniref:NAD(P)-binding domain-containing protein n=1 Tax=Brassica cretica TaxID=69181 RepID=A0ABQ7BJ80_BRACR|nr:hypothetical protein DY000_02037409 [Brassica cretica]
MRGIDLAGGARLRAGRDGRKRDDRRRMGLLRWRESRADNVVKGRIDYKDTLHNDMVKLIKTKVERVFHVAGYKPPMDSSLELVWSRLWTIYFMIHNNSKNKSGNHENKYNMHETPLFRNIQNFNTIVM